MSLRRFVGRCDSESAAHAVNRRRVKSYPMHEALMCLVEGEERHELKTCLAHAPTQDNKVTDLLSREDITRAMDLARREWGRCDLLCLNEEWIRELEERVREEAPEAR